MFDKISACLEKISTVLNDVSKILLGCIVLFMVGIITLQVFLRYVLNTGFNWPEEVTTFLMAWMTFLGSAIAVKQSEHINIQVFVNALPATMTFIVRLMAKVILLLFILIFTYLGYAFAVGSMGYTANTVDISLFWPRLSLVVGGTLMILHMVVLIMKDIRGGVKG